MGIETIAIILLILFTLEIIFIFVYSSQKDDSQIDNSQIDNSQMDNQGWGPPELPSPPPTNIFEFPEGPHGYFPRSMRPRRRMGGWDDDDDYDFDDDYRKKDKLRRIKFILSKNHDFFHTYDKNAKEVGSDFRSNNTNKEFIVHLDKINYEKYKDYKLFMTYRPTELSFKWFFIDNKGNVIKELNRNEAGNIELEVPLINSKKNKNDLIFFIYKKKNEKK